MNDFTFQVDLKGMIRLLSENLYSNDSIFLRELLQNATDAIEARRMEEPTFNDALIEVTLGKDGMLEFSDNGIGLTKDEIHSFLSVIGNSSKRNDVCKQGFIGQFGIGLLSCFLVADNIEVLTRSAKANCAYRWLGQSNGAYSVDEAPQYTRRGTTVRLQLTSIMQERYSTDVVRGSLSEYSFMLNTPVWLESEEGRERTNDAFIPFRTDCCTTSQLLDFGEQVFERIFMDAILINEEGISGCIFISAAPANSATMQQHKIYLKNMLITEDGKELVPKWAFFVQCFLNTDDLTPTASREGFYRDSKLYKVKAGLERSIIDYLIALSEVEPQRLISILNLHNTAIKSLAVDNDRVFQLMFPFLLFTTNKGDATGKQILTAARKSWVYYCTTVEDFRKIRPLLENSNTLLVNSGYVYDTALIRRATRTNRALHIKELSDNMIGDLLQAVGNDEAAQFNMFLEYANAALRRFGCCVQLRKFSPVELPGLFAPGGADIFNSSDDEADEDFFAEENEYAEDVLLFNCLYLNVACPLVRGIAKLDDVDNLSLMAEVIYLQALMQGGHAMGTVEMKLLNQNLTRLIELGLN